MLQSVFTVGKLENSSKIAYRRETVSLHIRRLQKSVLKQLRQSKTPEDSLRYGKGIFEDWLQKFSSSCQRFFPFFPSFFRVLIFFLFNAFSFFLSIQSFCFPFFCSLPQDKSPVVPNPLFYLESTLTSFNSLEYHDIWELSAHSNIFLSLFPISGRMLVKSQDAKSATLTHRPSASTWKITTSKVAENRTKSHRAINSQPEQNAFDGDFPSHQLWVRDHVSQRHRPRLSRPIQTVSYSTTMMFLTIQNLWMTAKRIPQAKWTPWTLTKCPIAWLH